MKLFWFLFNRPVFRSEARHVLTAVSKTSLDPKFSWKKNLMKNYFVVFVCCENWFGYFDTVEVTKSAYVSTSQITDLKISQSSAETFVSIINPFIHSFIIFHFSFILSLNWLINYSKTTLQLTWTETRIQSVCSKKLEMGLNFSIIYGLFQAMPLNLLSVMVEYRSITLLLIYRPSSRAPTKETPPTKLHMCP